MDVAARHAFQCATWLILPSAKRALCAGGTLEQLGEKSTKITKAQGYKLLRWRIGLDLFSMFTIIPLGSGLGTRAIQKFADGQEDIYASLFGVSFGLFFLAVLPTILAGWWTAMKTGSTLARNSVDLVITAAEKTDPMSEEWEPLVAQPALALEDTMRVLSDGFGSGLCGFVLMFWLFTAANFSCAIYPAFLEASDRQNGVEPGTKKEKILKWMLWMATMPLLVCVDLATTSSRYDELLNTLNRAGIMHSERSYHCIAWLESRLRQMNSDQGMGFLVGSSMVLDRRSLTQLAVGVGGGAVTLITAMLAMSEDAQAITATGVSNATCALSPTQIATTQSLCGTENNRRCRYNIDSVLRLKTDDASSASCSLGAVDAANSTAWSCALPATCETGASATAQCVTSAVPTCETFAVPFLCLRCHQLSQRQTRCAKTTCAPGRLGAREVVPCEVAARTTLCLGERGFYRSVACDAPPMETHSWPKAMFLSLFFGGFGVDRFYLGYPWTGLCKLLSLGGLGLWTVCDVVRVALGDLGPADGYAYTTV